MDGEAVSQEGARSAAELGQLDTVTRLKLARGIMDKTCVETGAGYLLIVFLPGTDLMLRSFRGLDSPEERVAAAAEVAGMLHPHVEKLRAAAAGGVAEKHNDA